MHSQLSHQKQAYDILLREAAAAVQAVAQDPAWVGGTVGILVVLHTWSRTLTYHPHAHLLVTAGALAPDDSAWLKPAHARFLAPGYALSQVFRARLRAALNRAGLAAGLDPALWNRKWVVHVQQIGRGEHAALYLSRYVYRVALSNDRIERFANGEVTFRYTHARTHETRRMTLPVDQFIDRFLLHTLPRGFAKVRSYGLLSPGNGQKLERARQILEQHALTASPPPPAPIQTSGATAPDTIDTLTTGRCCPVCHAPHLLLVQRLRRSRAPP